MFENQGITGITLTYASFWDENFASKIEIFGRNPQADNDWMLLFLSRDQLLGGSVMSCKLPKNGMELQISPGIKLQSGRRHLNPIDQ